MADAAGLIIKGMFENFEGGLLELENVEDDTFDEVESIPPWPPTATEIRLVGFHSLKTLPPLPAGLISLQIAECENLSSLPPFPAGFKILTINDFENLTVLPPFPEGLVTLFIANAVIPPIPALPASLERIQLIRINLQALPPLPAGLKELIVKNNPIKELPVLPSLVELNVTSNRELKSLPELPNTLQKLKCNNCQLESLPTLPDSLTVLLCNNNRDLIGIPTLPPRLQTLDCSLCQLTELPELPESLEYLNCSHNAFTILPRLPARLMQLDARNLSNLEKLTPPCPEDLKLVRVSEIFGYTEIVPKPEVGELLGAYMNRLQGLPPPSEPMWTGYSRADVELFKSFFVEATRNSVSVCPVCLAYADRIDGCMYMSHTCDPEARHEELYRKYSDDEGKIQWCTICGRISGGHRHFTLNLPDEKRPAYVQFQAENVIDHFQEDCRPVGGGGFEEKFRRLEKLLNYACQLQDEVGKSAAKKIREELIEEVWKAALMKDRTVIKKFESGKFDFPCEFPDDVKPTVPEKEYPDVPVPDDLVLPTKHDKEGDRECLTELGEHDDHRPVYQFNHRQPDGSVWNHVGEFVCGPDLESGLRANQFTGLCPINPERCKAKLYPAELNGVVTDEFREIYRRLFNKQFEHVVQVAGGQSIMRKMDPAGIQCPVMPKGGRKTYRRKRRALRKRGPMRSSFKKHVRVKK